MLYPLHFTPLFKQYLWGGRKLADSLGKRIGKGDNYAESWEVCDHDADQSVIAYGPLAGAKLCDLMLNIGRDLLGCVPTNERFPLLVKFLDARQTLSVQVHPNDEQAAHLTPPDFGKTEAWYVLEAESQSLIYAGLKQGVDRQALEKAIKEGKCRECLHSFTPQPGDLVFLPAGTVHALGAGLLIAEIQQSSDTTFRLYDWDRVDADGKPRPLHIAQALDVIDFAKGPLDPLRNIPADSTGVTRLMQCEKFVIDKLDFNSTMAVGGDERCHIIIVLDGTVTVENDPAKKPLIRGETILLPASIGLIRFTPKNKKNVTVLDVYLPN
jgi:mannose-6-phosphate isomerase